MSDAGLEQQRFDSACHRQMSGDLRGARSDFLALAADLAGRYPAVSAQHDTGDICDDIDFSLAAIQERLGHAGLAAGYAARGNRRRRQRALAAGIRPASDIRHLAAMAATLAPDAIAHWQRLPMNLEQPIFLLGIPQSGHQALHTHLAQHRDVRLVAGQDLLAESAAQLTAHGDDLATALGTLSPQFADQLRTDYLARRAARAGAPDTAAVIIDSGPHNLPYLGLIARLFPNARLIITVRHPLDLCLSQWMAATPVDEVGIHFTSLAETAALYHRWMLIWSAAEKVLPINVHNFNREEALHEPAAAFAKLYQFLALRADPAVPPRLPLDPFDPPGRWRRQRQLLAPYRHKLSLWAEDLGFAV